MNSLSTYLFAKKSSRYSSLLVLPPLFLGPCAQHHIPGSLQEDEEWSLLRPDRRYSLDFVWSYMFINILKKPHVLSALALQLEIDLSSLSPHMLYLCWEKHFCCCRCFCTCVAVAAAVAPHF